MHDVLRSIGCVIRPSPETGDHELILLVDGEDILSRRSVGMGLDPSDFFKQPGLRFGGQILIGRCGCGTIGCDDISVQVAIGETSVEWRGDAAQDVFSKTAYYDWLDNACKDYSWEDLPRRTERLVEEVLVGAELTDGRIFEWASARIEACEITLSFLDGGIQALSTIGWDGKDPSTAVSAAQAFRAKHGT